MRLPLHGHRCLRSERSQKRIGHLYGRPLHLFGLAHRPDGHHARAIPNQSIQITPSQTDSVSSIDFSLPNFVLGELVLGDINLPGIGVVAGDSVYSFAPNAPQSLTFLPGTDDQIDALVSINDSTSSIKNSEAVINIDVVWVMSEDSQTPIYVAFVGKKTVDAGISQVATTENKAKGIYTLTGVRVNTTDVKSLPKGIYIVDGKKEIVK